MFSKCLFKMWLGSLFSSEQKCEGGSNPYNRGVGIVKCAPGVTKTKLREYLRQFNIYCKVKPLFDKQAWPDEKEFLSSFYKICFKCNACLGCFVRWCEDRDNSVIEIAESDCACDLARVDPDVPRVTPRPGWDREFVRKLLPRSKSKKEYRPRIAVIDTGLDWKHPGFENAEEKFFTIPGNTNVGLNIFTRKGLNPGNDKVGHGTHVVGIIGASNRELHAEGICPTCEIFPIKAFHDNGRACVSDLMRAVVAACCHEAKIISMSFSVEEKSDCLGAVLKKASKKKVFLVAAAGNKGVPLEGNNESTYTFPAAYDFVLGVEALISENSLAPFSNRGYDVQLPGACIKSTLPEGKYGTWSGTSMAAPAAAAVIGCYLNHNSGWDPPMDELRGIFRHQRYFRSEGRNSKFSTNPKHVSAQSETCTEEPKSIKPLDLPDVPKIPEVRLPLFKRLWLGHSKKPRVIRITITDKCGNSHVSKHKTIILKENKTYYLTLEYSHPMNPQKSPKVSFGLQKPFEDFRVEGNWISETRWQGIIPINYSSGFGKHTFKVVGAEGVNTYVQKTSCNGKAFITGEGPPNNGSAGGGILEVHEPKIECPEDATDWHHSPIVSYNIFLSKGATKRFEQVNTFPHTGQFYYFDQETKDDYLKGPNKSKYFKIDFITVTGRKIPGQPILIDYNNKDLNPSS